jgi:hypothetical protein
VPTRTCRSLTILPLALLLAACISLQRPTLKPSDDLPEFNRIVLEVCSEYPTDGTHGYWWPKGRGAGYDGCTQDLYFQGVKVMDGEPKGRTYCCGFTLEVFLEAYNRWLERHELEPTLQPSDWPQFQHLWFVPEINGTGPSAALERFHLGRQIASTEAVAGDFVSLWRTETDSGKISGHSVIFLGWTHDLLGHISGFRYFSTQPGTDGIGFATEHFGADGGLSRRFTWYGRAEPGTPQPPSSRS